ncbi:DUF1015 family protein [Pedobacter sp. LMG 31464]|uniref:DUF1015 family protein n=1 Tax=Pedobacter planticolens TaxID=2679964 RepID=A0A923E214_9SPHI|nr:DUF1015 family protein [Pedobacter planticolens]MBB2146795.1 DUF1015 family protein [Pedobacter planticolens]
MATIKPFRAVRPSTASLRPLDFLQGKAKGGLELDYLKFRLETSADPNSPTLSDCREFLDSLLENRSYVLENELSLYVYERITDGHSRTGVFALTSLNDLQRGEIFTHELTLETMEEKITDYRIQVGLEGAAILLTHEPNALIDELIRRAQGSRQVFSYAYGDSYHKFWKITNPSQLEEFQLAFSSLRQVYLADGHHRLGSADKLHRVSAQWISSLYMSSNQLDIQPFHRLVLPNKDFHLEKALERIGEYFFISTVPNNIAYRPNKKHRMGMCIAGKWYQLDLRPELKLDQPIDVAFLQDRILSGIFGISEPRTDVRLRCHADRDFKKLLLEIAREPSAVAFTLFGLGMEEFLRLSLMGKLLPPKSTSIGPKPMFGMLMHCTRSVLTKGGVQ